MSLESLRFMLGGHIHRSQKTGEKVLIYRTEEVVTDDSGKVPLPKDHITGNTLTPTAIAGHPIKFINLTDGSRTQIEATTSNSQTTPVAMTGNETLTFHNPRLLDADHTTGTYTGVKAHEHIRIFWVEEVTPATSGTSAVEVTISPDTFPGTYRVVGDTFMRSQETGKDEAFQFVIEKAKVLSDVTITLEAEGDPSTFSMSLSVLRASNERGANEMMKLIRYGVEDTSVASTDNDIGSLA